MHVMGIALLVPVLPFSSSLKCLQHWSASHLALAANLPWEIYHALFKAEVNGRSIAALQSCSWRCRSYLGPSESSFQCRARGKALLSHYSASVLPGLGPAVCVLFVELRLVSHSRLPKLSLSALADFDFS